MSRFASVVLVIALTAAVVLAGFKINPNTVTTSGISAGGFFAVQFQVAFSDVIQGAGIVAGGPFYCSQGFGLAAALECIDAPLTIDVSWLELLTQFAESEGKIAPLANLANRTFLLFSGTRDTVVPQKVMVDLNSQLTSFGVPSANIQTIFNVDAQHSWITNTYGHACSYLGSPYINNCNISFAGRFLKQAFEFMQLPFTNTPTAYNASNMWAFDQTAFGADASVSMGNTGLYYVPQACADGSVTCHVHVNFHGCEQQHSTIGLQYVSQTELNEYAESNNIIIIYPQATANQKKENPNGCFDWWGYDDVNFAFRNGTQMTMVKSILDHVLAGNTLPPSQ